MAYLAAYWSILTFPLFILPIPGLRYNWSGKLLAIGFSGLVLACSPWLRKNVGLRWRQAPGSLVVSLAAFILILWKAAYQGVHASGTDDSAETLLFQFTMPGIDEELACRGIALALLEHGFGHSPMSCRLRLGWAAFIISLLFGMAHGVMITEDEIRLLWRPFLFALIFGCVMALLRTRSGSLLWPILCHATADGGPYLVAAILHR